MGLSSNCCHSNIGGVSAEQHSVGAKVSDIEPTPSPPPAQGLSRPPWHEAVVRKQGSDTPHRRRGVAAGRRRARRRRDSKDSEAQRRAHPPSRPAGRPRRRHSARRHRRHERACSNQQHSRATTTRSRPNTAQSGPRTIWCSLSRRGASEGRIGLWWWLVWVTSAVESDISKESIRQGRDSIRQGRDSIQRAVKRPETI